MSEERKKILEMLASGKINADEADRLLTVFEQNKQQGADTIEVESFANSGKPKYLHVKVNGGCHNGRENVDVKIPLALLKAGIKIGSLMPDKVKGKFSAHMNDHGVDFDLNDLDSKKIDAFVIALKEHPIDIQADNETVKIFCA